MKQEILDQGDPRKYFAAIPNIVMTLGLNPYELALYAYLKSVAGEDGVCWKSTATMARETRMGAGTISKVKASLSEPRPMLNNKSLIVIVEETRNGGNPNHLISITDIWPENMAELSRVREVKATRSPRERARSPQEARVHQAKARVHVVVTNKNPEQKPIKKNPEEPSPHSRLMDFQQLRTGPIANGARDGKAAKWLLDHGYDRQQCEECFDALMAQEWRTSAVSWQTVQTNIGAWLARGMNGTNGNGHKPTASEKRVDQLKANMEFIAGLANS